MNSLRPSLQWGIELPPYLPPSNGVLDSLQWGIELSPYLPLMGYWTLSLPPSNGVLDSFPPKGYWTPSLPPMGYWTPSLKSSMEIPPYLPLMGHWTPSLQWGVLVSLLTSLQWCIGLPPSNGVLDSLTESGIEIPPYLRIGLPPNI